MANRFRNQPRLTLGLIALNVLIWVGQILPGTGLTQALWFAPVYFPSEPWRMLTSGFAHDPSNIFHILMNMYSLYVLGQVLEPMLGRARFLTIYLASILGGSIFVLFLGSANDVTVGASGGIFGLMAAYFVFMRAIGVNSRGIVGIIAINLIFTFMSPGISWQGHIGGLLIGGAVAASFLSAHRRKQRGL
jgi:membrane associated rhomboid family serine protease